MSSERRLKNHSFGNFFLTYSLVFVWIALIAIFGALIPEIFLTWSNFTMMFGSKAVVVLLALATMIPLIAGDFDMSTASVLTLCAMVVAVTNARLGWPLIASIVLALAVGALVGWFNGLILSKLNVNPFIVTMAVGTVLNGVTLMICKSLTITGVDKILQKATLLTRVGGIPLVFFYAVALAIVLFYFFEFTAAGRKVLVVGRNRNVAQLSGINVGRVRWSCFITSGLISALAGILYAGVLGGADPTSGTSFQLPAFAACFLGSICIKPGRFNPIGCLVAVYFLLTGTTGLSLMGIQTYIQDIFNGGALVVAVCVSVVIRLAQEKRMAKSAKAELKAEIQKSE